MIGQGPAAATNPCVQITRTGKNVTKGKSQPLVARFHSKRLDHCQSIADKIFESDHPFGSPVVPDVYRIVARSLVSVFAKAACSRLPGSEPLDPARTKELLGQRSVGRFIGDHGEILRDQLYYLRNLLGSETIRPSTVVHLKVNPCCQRGMNRT